MPRHDAAGPTRGSIAPEFELFDETGTLRRLSELRASASVVLFFYPAANSYGCTRECRHFRDLSAEFAALHATPVGISHDGPEVQAAFKAANGLGFVLLSDPDYVVATTYGTRRRTDTVPLRRRTFVIGRDARVLEVITSETRMAAHADRALRVLRSVTA